MHRQAPRSVHVLLALAALTAALHAQGTPIGFEETYALAADRAKAVATLIPGSEDWYYWHCRERLDARDFDSVRKVLPAWIQRHGRSARVFEVEDRDALLSASSEGERTFDFLRQRLGYRFDHQRVVPGATSDLPTRLDPAFLSAGNLLRNALARSQETVDAFTDAGLPALAAQNLTPRQLRSGLSRQRNPHADNVAEQVVRDLETQ